MVTSPLNTEYRQIFRVMDTITITGNELHAFAAKIAQIAKDELLRELRTAGMILSENEAREYKKYKAASEPLVKQSEAARMLGVSPQTIMRMKDNGTLKPTILENGMIRYKKSQILALKNRTA